MNVIEFLRRHNSLKPYFIYLYMLCIDLNIPIMDILNCRREKLRNSEHTVICILPALSKLMIHIHCIAFDVCI